MAGETLVAIQQQFNQSLVSGVTYAIANHPIIGWGGTFSLPKIITGVALVIAVADLLTKLVDHKSFITSFVKLVFYFVLVLANFGQINHRSFLPIADYVGNVDSQNQAPPKEIEMMYRNNPDQMPKRTSAPLLDRDLYNTVKVFFDSLADQLSGYQSAEDAAQEQKTAMYDTIFYLQQIRLARLKCVNEETDSAIYIDCMKQYVPTSDPNPTNNPNAVITESAACSGQKCKGEADDYKKGATNEAGESSWSISSIASQATEALTGVFHVIVAAIQMVYFIFSDFVMLVFFPVIMWLLEFIRNLVAAYVLITIGFKAAGMLFFAKLMSPLILLDSKRSQVFGAYKSLFALAAFNFISQLFVVFSTIMAIGLKNAVYDNIAVSLLQTGTGSGSGVDMTANIGTLTFLVYTGLFVVSLLQIMAIMKIEKACDALINFSVQEFVGIGRELAGSAVKIAMVASAGVMAAPALVAAAPIAAGAGSAASTVGGLAAKAGAAASKIPGASRVLSAGRGLASQVGNSRAASLAKQAGRSVGRQAINSGEKAADYFLGEESGDKFRALLGKGGNSGGQGSSADITAKKKVNNNDLRDDGDEDSDTNTSSNSDKKPNGSDGEGSSGNQKGARSSNKNDDSTGGKSESNGKGNKQKKKGAAFLENPINKTILRGLKSFDAGLSMAEHIKSRGIEGSIAATMRGYDNGNGLGNQVYKHQASAVKNVNNTLDALNEDPQSRSKIQAFNQGLDNLNDDVKMDTHGRIYETLNGQSLDKMDNPTRKEYWKTMNSVENGDVSDENLNKLYNLAQNNQLDKGQKNSLEKLLRSEASVGRHFAERQKAEEKIVKKYANDPTINNANQLYNAYSEGQVSKQVLASHAKDLTAQANKKYEEAHSKVKTSVDKLDVNKYKTDANYKNSAEARSATAVMDNMVENEYLKTKLIGDHNLIEKMEALNKITEEEAQAMKKFSSNNELNSTISGFKSELSSLDKNKSLRVDENIEIRMHDEGIIMYDKQYQKTIRLEDGIKISQIKDKSVAEKFIQYKNALTIIKNNPKEFVEKGIISAESINRLDDILSYIED